MPKKMRKLTDNQRKMIMAMCAKQGIDDELRADLAFQFSTGRTTHTSELSSAEATELIQRLKANQSSTDTTMDVWRKRLMAAVAAYLKSKNYEPTPDRIKATACRAAGMPNADCFNQIPLDRLRGLYNAFRNAARDMKEVKQMDADLTAALAVMN